jgi:hypothetical protein
LAPPHGLPPAPIADILPQRRERPQWATTGRVVTPLTEGLAGRATRPSFKGSQISFALVSVAILEV